MLAANLEKVETNLEIQVVDVDVRDDLVVEFGIRSVPVLIMMDEQNQEVARAIGVKTVDQLRDWISINE